MKKHIILILLFLSIFIPCTDVKTGVKANVLQAGMTMGIQLGEYLACALFGYKIAEAIKKKDPKVLISVDTLLGGAVIAFRLGLLVRNINNQSTLLVTILAQNAAAKISTIIATLIIGRKIQNAVKLQPKEIMMH